MFCFNLTQKDTKKIRGQNKCILHLLSSLAMERGARTHGPPPNWSYDIHLKETN